MIDVNKIKELQLGAKEKKTYGVGFVLRNLYKMPNLQHIMIFVIENDSE